MRNPARISAIFSALLPGLCLLSACAGTYGPSANAPARVERPAYGNALAFAQGACGSCHAVEYGALSPNPRAIEWPSVVNAPGVTSDTLRSWLVDAHNYPEEMDFDLDRPQVEELVTYMMTLKRTGYEPPS